MTFYVTWFGSSWYTYYQRKHWYSTVNLVSFEWFLLFNSVSTIVLNILYATVMVVLVDISLPELVN